MDIARYSVDRPVATWLIILACLLGGLWGLLTIGRLEDPAFTLKQAVVVTPYPGATAAEVEEEVTERLESAIQQMPQLRHVTSRSRPGVSEIEVEIQPTYSGAQLPQIWDELRRRVGDAQAGLPEGAGPSVVDDDFGDVFGFFYAVTAPGFPGREVREIARTLRRDLLAVPGVAKVELSGVPEEAIIVEVPQERLARLGIPLETVVARIGAANAVVESGWTRQGDLRVRLVTPPGFDTLRGLERVRVGRPGTTEQVSLLDLAAIRREATEEPDTIIAHNGVPAFTLAVSAVRDANVVEVGRGVAARVEELIGGLPRGVEIHPIYEQHEVVAEAMDGFLVNLAMSVAIVVGVLCLFMGWRVGLVVGATLLLTVSGTVFGMRLGGIEMERISLGALIIAMGMLVDNAIVVAEGMLINMARGMTARDAAGEAARRTQVPLLGATVIGIMAFAGIGLSPDETGEFLFSLFAVIAVSLLLSWVLAITVTPLLGHYLLRPVPAGAGGDPYAGRSYRAYRGTLRAALRLRWLTLGVLVGLTGAAFWGFGQVRQAFFPDTNTPIFFLDVRLPQGTDIRATAAIMREVDAEILRQDGVVAVSSFAGRGASRFMLTYEPELPNPGYAQSVVRTTDLEAIDPLAARLAAWIRERHPQAEVRTSRLVYGPGGGTKIEARFSGPDAAVLRDLADRALRAMAADGRIIDLHHDWREREPVAVPRLDDDRAALAGVTRADVALALRVATAGVQAGTYREGDTSVPILVRAPEAERRQGRLLDRLVWSEAEATYVPISQVVVAVETGFEEAVIRRRDRIRTLTVKANPEPGETADAAFRRIRGQIEAIPLPSGYRLEWGGEYEDAGDANASLAGQLPFSFLAMLAISVLLFGKLRQPLVIWLVVPMAVCGVVVGLLATGLPFTFVALLGLLSLSGMLMKNAIVLVDEIDAQIAGGAAAEDAIPAAAVSRLRPIALAAGTTILGMLPLLWDAFFASMAVTIMAGLAFASVLSLVAVPVLYGVLVAGGAPRTLSGRAR